MESVKILFTNRIKGSGKSTLCLALANYLNDIVRDAADVPTIIDCTNNFSLYNKRKEEIEKDHNINPAIEILRLSMVKEESYNNCLNFIYGRDAIYLFDLPPEIKLLEFSNLLMIADIIIIPVIMSEDGLKATAKFILEIEKLLSLCKVNGLEKSPNIIFIPNNSLKLFTEINDCNDNMLLPKLKSFGSFSPHIEWKENLFEELSTLKWTKEDNIFFKPVLEPIIQYIKNNF